MQKRYLSTKELSEYINISVNTIYSWVWQKRIPHIKFGRLVRFDLKAIDEWAGEKNVKVADWWKE